MTRSSLPEGVNRSGKLTHSLGDRWFRQLDHPAVFLTYDDGPHPAVTPVVLEVLQRFEASATFFVSGESLDHPTAPELLAQIVDLGHTIGNHGQHHSQDEYPDFELMQRRIERSCGVRTGLFRAPYGCRHMAEEYLNRDPDVLAFHWTHHFEDWRPLDWSAAARTIPEAVQPGAILLLHDGSVSVSHYRERGHVIELTERIAEEARRRGVAMLGLSHAHPNACTPPANARISAR